MAISRRVPIVGRELVGGARGRDALRQLRGVELACQTRDEAEQLAELIACQLPDPVRARLASLAAATDESTPPDIATTMRMKP